MACSSFALAFQLEIFWFEVVPMQLKSVFNIGNWWIAFLFQCGFNARLFWFKNNLFMFWRGSYVLKILVAQLVLKTFERFSLFSFWWYFKFFSIFVGQIFFRSSSKDKRNFCSLSYWFILELQSKFLVSLACNLSCIRL